MITEKDMKNSKVYKLVLAAMFLALALVLPFLTGQIPQIGKRLCPMHIPVLLCGFFCGPWYALAVGFIAPYLRFALFQMPAVIPDGFVMSFELATYGMVAGLLYKMFPPKKIFVYVSLVLSMIAGRISWALASLVLLSLGKAEFGWPIFVAKGFVNPLPGIVLQVVLIPILVMTLKKFTAGNDGQKKE